MSQTNNYATIDKTLNCHVFNIRTLNIHKRTTLATVYTINLMEFRPTRAILL